MEMTSRIRTTSKNEDNLMKKTSTMKPEIIVCGPLDNLNDFRILKLCGKKKS